MDHTILKSKQRKQPIKKKKRLNMNNNLSFQKYPIHDDNSSYYCISNIRNRKGKRYKRPPKLIAMLQESQETEFKFFYMPES